MQTPSNIEIDWTKVKAGLMSAATGFSCSRSSIAGAENIATGLRIIANAIIDVAEEEKRTFKQKKADFVAALGRAKSPREMSDAILNAPPEVVDAALEERRLATEHDMQNGYRE